MRAFRWRAPLAAAAVVAGMAAPSAQLRLADESDRAAFRGWFVLLAGDAFYRPVAEVTDCAGLIRFAARESLRAHTPEWRRTIQLPIDPGLADVRQRPTGAPGRFPLFRISAEPKAALVEFADARTIIRYNARFVARDAGALRPGDLLYFQQPSQSEPDHLMIYVGPSHFDASGADFLVYHTGPADAGKPGEMRKVRLADLLKHPSPRWRPLASNERFVGVFRLTVENDAGAALSRLTQSPKSEVNLRCPRTVRLTDGSPLPVIRSSVNILPPRAGSPMTPPRSVAIFSVVVCLLGLAATRAAAGDQDSPEDTRPSFSLSTSAIVTSRETPAIYLTFRRLDHLDFRVYRVNDPMKFLAGLKDPHQLGSEEPIVSQVPTLLERVADWKSEWRWRVRNFFRTQFTWGYRHARRQQMDQQTVVQRRTVNVNTFAQVPVLNASQLVTSWREILPPRRDADVRRIPIDVKQPGMPSSRPCCRRTWRTRRHRLDIGLVTKASPGQVLLYAADRNTGKPVSGCNARRCCTTRRCSRRPDGRRRRARRAFRRSRDRRRVAVATCGDQVTATDPGSYYMNSPARELVGCIYTDKPIYRPGHTVHIKGLLRWRSHGALVPFDAPDAEVRISDTTDKAIFRQRRKVDSFGGITADLPLSAGVALGGYSVAVLVGDDAASGSFEVQEYRKPEFEVRAMPTDKFVVQDGEAHVTITARYYFGQPVSGGRVAWVAHRQPYFSPLRWSDEEPGEGGDYWWGGEEQALEGTARLDASGKADLSIPIDVDERGNDYSLRIEARVTDPSSRQVSGFTTVNAMYGRSPRRVTVDQCRQERRDDDSEHPRGGLPERAAGEAVKVTVASRVPGKSWRTPAARRW